MKKPVVSSEVSAYLRRIARKGGLKSRRVLSSSAARDMVRVREARRAFLRFYTRCFWFMDPDTTITLDDVPAIVRGLRQNGGREGFVLAAKLCR